MVATHTPQACLGARGLFEGSKKGACAYMRAASERQIAHKVNETKVQKREKGFIYGVHEPAMDVLYGR